jgi:hypothetical protein
MLIWGRRHALLVLSCALMLGLAACGPANERPVSGAVPGSRTAPTPPGVPPTLSPSEALKFRALPTPSPGLNATAANPSPSASPGAVASPSTVAAPPIVRTISPAANGRVAPGQVSLSAVLVGRGADLATASLTLNGAEAGAQIDKRSAREWTIRTSQALANGSYTARVLVRDSSGANGGFTWQFSVGEPEPAAPAEQPAEQPAAAPSAVPKPRTP